MIQQIVVEVGLWLMLRLQILCDLWLVYFTIKKSV